MKPVYTILFVFIFNFIFADGMHIKGEIKDIDTKKPVIGANVIITFYKGVEFSDITDSLGRYDILTNIVVPEGDYNIQMYAKNYWDIGGIVLVNKECTRNFFIKTKTEDTTNVVVKIEPVLTVPNPEISNTVLEGYATNNLVFLIDISSSMNAPEKMPLLKESLKYLINELRPTDKVAILTFSSTVKEVLPSTLASQKELILKTIDELGFGNTTQGGKALSFAYNIAENNSIQKGNNRIVLISDGLFTSGEKDYKKMREIIESGVEKNISLSIFCFGKATEYVNTKLNKLSITGNGNYAVITAIEDAKLHFIEEAKALKSQE